MKNQYIDCRSLADRDCIVTLSASRVCAHRDATTSKCETSRQDLQTMCRSASSVRSCHTIVGLPQSEATFILPDQSYSDNGNYDKCYQSQSGYGWGKVLHAFSCSINDCRRMWQPWIGIEDSSATRSFRKQASHCNSFVPTAQKDDYAVIKQSWIILHLLRCITCDTMVDSPARWLSVGQA